MDELDELGEESEVPVSGRPVRVVPRPGRNEPCWCGSKRKYKKCHLESDDRARLGGS